MSRYTGMYSNYVLMLITSLIFADVVEFWKESKEEIVDDIEISPPHLEQCNDIQDKNMLVMVTWITALLKFMRRSYGLSDAAIGTLLKVLFGVLGKISHPCSVIAKCLPPSLYIHLLSTFSLHVTTKKSKQFCRYVVCQNVTLCISLKNAKKFGMQASIRTISQSSPGQNEATIPQRHILLFKSSKFFAKFRSSFVTDTELWRLRKVPRDTLQDVYDGDI